MRKSGILMHITSLPGPWGIGTMGKEAYRFVDFLKRSGQSLWQILPLTPTGYGDSPYQSCSTFAGNPFLIDLDTLVEQDLLKRSELEAMDWDDGNGRVNFGKQYYAKWLVLRKAYGRFTANEEFDRFCMENTDWLPDYALFMSLKEKLGGTPWYQWDKALRDREEVAMCSARAELADNVRFHSFVQYLFYSQWEALRLYTNQAGISIIGDVPIYVPYDSVEVWSNPELFQLDGNKEPTAVAGCPPDGFTADGQLWGNPLYRWDIMAKDGYAWWLRRMGAAGKLYDMVRLDHFRGFQAYWAVPFGDKTAKGGKWVLGPGMDFVRSLIEGLPNMKFIAEDLGFLTQEVLDLRDESGLPGMKVLGFAFDSRESSGYLPHSFTSNSVVYTGTHDNMTMRQWAETVGREAVEYAREYLGIPDWENLTWACIRAAHASVSDSCVIQMQDYLDLGASARMNFPGTMTSDNWTWRADYNYISDDLAQSIYRLTKLYERLPKEEKPEK